MMSMVWRNINLVEYDGFILAKVLVSFRADQMDG